MRQHPLASSPAAQCADVAHRYAAVRAATEALARPLSAEDCCVQSMPDASPAKWHLAHTSWFFETFILERHESGFRPFDPAFRVLFNSYYQGVGRQHPRPQRGLLTRPSLATVQAYRAEVDARMQRLLAQGGLSAEVAALLELGLQHEQQHQELILTDIKHLLWCNPLWPAYHEEPALPDGGAVGAGGWRNCRGGLVQIGHQGADFAFDNELPRHSVYLQPYALATRLVTNAEYLAFMAEGGYDEPAHWLAEGWDWCRAQQLAHPLYWRQQGQDWREFTLAGAQPLAPHQAVAHLSYYEADAYARWAGARLPTEAEWETASADEGDGLQQMFGVLWQWTQSSYAPYPGFAPAPGAVGEYNGKFMVNQYVLRGSSCATPAGHARASYRNFFPAAARWQFTGLRLARDS
ncbi:ergothioneine biosynthesis protein EgtB [Alicycliphilus denitrificans]|uniref:ergothioneine biosynthesis protein EgtB n=1 Tax=Alicycliphilus denitrificans TaxID=179636 RepID=UPI00384D918A